MKATVTGLTILCKHVQGFFASPRALAIEKEIALLLPAALKIVEEINAAAPNKTVGELNAIAEKYALPTINELAEGQTAGNVALNLGSKILAQNHAPAAGTILLNTVVQLAVMTARTVPTAAA